MHSDSPLKRPDLWIGSLLGTGLFVLADSLSIVGQGDWMNSFLSGAFYFHLVVLAAAGHYLVKGSKIPRISKRLMIGFLVLPFALLVFSAVLSPTEWFVGYGNWGQIFAALCSQVLPAALLVFLLLILGVNARKERSLVRELGCYSLAAISSLSFMIWLEGSIGIMSGVLMLQVVAATTFVVGRHTGRVAALRCSRSSSR